MTFVSAGAPEGQGICPLSFSESYGGDISGAYSAEQGFDTSEDTDEDVDEILPYDGTAVFPLPMKRDVKKPHVHAVPVLRRPPGEKDKIQTDGHAHSGTSTHESSPSQPSEPSQPSQPLQVIRM